MDRLREQIDQVAGTDLDVLLRGETGTGKELVATAIHRASRRAGAPLVSVNMAAIPTGLAAAALFGTARGAYTGAGRASEGYFRQADGGTLFLDEIGDAPQEIQPQLLRALQQREIQCVGGPLRRVDLRVISATDAALEGDDCNFKAALRHRLAASEIRLPPLREHPEDIGELLRFFLDEALAEVGRSALLPGAASPPADIAAWAELFYGFLGYRWPGNVRELANFAKQVAVASATRLQVPEHIAAALREQPDQVPQPPHTPVPAEPAGPHPRRTIHEVSDEAFDRACEEQGYEVARVARALGVSRQAVYRRIELSPRHLLAGQVPEPELRRVLAEHGGDVEAAAGQLRVSVSALRARLRNAGQSGSGGVR
jgi:two-component system nitrogen regulation response regulator GlnG